MLSERASTSDPLHTSAFLSSSLLGPSISHRGHRLSRQTPRTPLVSPFPADSTGLARVSAQLQVLYNDYSCSTRLQISLTPHYSIKLLSYK
ncbi:hypothetical protein ACLB2K_037659 [Fragaria x ananassa]